MNTPISIGFVLFGLMFVFFGALSMLFGEDWLAHGLLFVGVGLFIGIKGASRLMASSAFRVAKVAAAGPVRLGESVRLVVFLDPKRPLKLRPEGCYVLVKTVERARYSAGTSSRLYQDVLFEQKHPLDLPADLNTSTERILDAPIPATIPPSWSGRSNSFATSATVHVDIDEWPDLEFDCPVTVLPEVFRG